MLMLIIPSPHFFKRNFSKNQMSKISNRKTHWLLEPVLGHWVTESSLLTWRHCCLMEDLVPRKKFIVAIELFLQT